MLEISKILDLWHYSHWDRLIVPDRNILNSIVRLFWVPIA
jgi:hypothetical protein